MAQNHACCILLSANYRHCMGPMCLVNLKCVALSVDLFREDISRSYQNVQHLIPCIVCRYRVGQKVSRKLLSISSPNIDDFHFFSRGFPIGTFHEKFVTN